jgi:23S rRNA (cytosine1962-C5)-methyltransferase
MSSVEAVLERALDVRVPFFVRAEAEQTDAYRIFHGTAEGREGLTIDRYGDLVLVQTFREPLEARELAAIEAVLRSRLEVEFHLVWNHRAKAAQESFETLHRASDAALRETSCRELGVRYAIRARHRGQDPWLFLDLRAGRRELQRIARGKSVLNLFAYTGAASVCALAAGASEAWSVDFARSSLEVATKHLALNAIDPERMRTIVEDCFPVLRQLAGLPVKGRGSRRPYVKVAPRRFDVVFLDPPAHSKSAFGAVDVERDYPSLFKPALQVLAPGGVVIATNHVARASPESFRAVLERCAEKAGRPLLSVEMIAPDDDFPSFDGVKPLKIAVCRA